MSKIFDELNLFNDDSFSKKTDDIDLFLIFNRV